VRDARVVALEQILVKAVVVAKQFPCRFETFGERVDRRAVEALVVHAADFEITPRSPDLVRKMWSSRNP